MSFNSASTSTLTGYQFFQGLCQPDDPAAAVMVPRRPSDEVQQKTGALQQILHTLMATDSGWPTDQPQTPVTLLPYVTDEAEELLEALPREPQLATAGKGAIAGRCASSPRLLSELCADWLWAIAASAPIAMQLLEGVAANIHDWPQVYGIRLVPMLEIQSEAVKYTLDLTTQSWGSLAPAIAPEASMQLLDLPTAPWVAAATLQTQIRDRSMALVPGLHSWLAGVTVQLYLPDTDWMTAHARLVLPLIPLTMQVTAPEPTLLEMPLPDIAATGLPTARVWQAAAAPATVVETRTAILNVPAQTYPWTLDSELTFAESGALAAALEALHRQELSQRIVDYARRYADLTPQALLEMVLNTSTESAVGGLTLGHAPLALSDLCDQVKWLWIHASQEYMPLMGGVSAQQLQSGRPWQSGMLMSQGQLTLLSDGQAIAALDVATGEWITAAPGLALTDWLQLSPTLSLPTTIWSVEQLTSLINQTMAARSPLLGSLMTPQPIQLWSPQDDLFPDLKPPALTLRWQVVLTFLPSFS